MACRGRRRKSRTGTLATEKIVDQLVAGFHFLHCPRSRKTQKVSSTRVAKRPFCSRLYASPPRKSPATALHCLSQAAFVVHATVLP